MTILTLNSRVLTISIVTYSYLKSLVLYLKRNTGTWHLNDGEFHIELYKFIFSHDRTWVIRTRVQITSEMFQGRE